MNNGTIYIVFCIDHNFVQHCASTISSVMSSYRSDKKVIFLIINDDLTANNEYSFRSIIKDNRFDITFVKIDKRIFKDMPVGGHTISDAISLSAYYRIGLPQILPLHIHKVIYLDSDIYVNDSIDKLWLIDLSEYAIAGVPEPEISQREKRRRLCIPNNYQYVNSGVSIMNLDCMRKISYTDKAIEYARLNYDRIIYHDQDIANALLYNKTCYLPYKWNMADCYLYKNPPLSGNALSQVIIARECPSLIHYAGYLKPWHKGCRNPYSNLYWEALKGTEWESASKSRREKSWFKELKLQICLLWKQNIYFK